MASEPHRLSPDRAAQVEIKLRARAEQLTATEQPNSPTTALGPCHACGKTVYAGEGLAKTGLYLFHADCTPAAADSARAP